MKSINMVWHEGRKWVAVAAAAEMAGLSEAAIYKAIRLGQLESIEILGVKAVTANGVTERWLQTEPESEVVA